MAAKKRSKSTIKPKRSIERGIEKGVEKERKARKPRVMKTFPGRSGPMLGVNQATLIGKSEGVRRLEKKANERNPFTKTSGGSISKGFRIGPLSGKTRDLDLEAQALKDEKKRRGRRQATKTRTKRLSTASKLAKLGIKKPGRK